MKKDWGVKGILPQTGVVFIIKFTVSHRDARNFMLDHGPQIRNRMPGVRLFVSSHVPQDFDHLAVIGKLKGDGR